jgi:hypothetical protein
LINDHGPSVYPGRGGLNSGCAVTAERTQRRRRALILVEQSIAAMNLSHNDTSVITTYNAAR